RADESGVLDARRQRNHVQERHQDDPQQRDRRANDAADKAGIRLAAVGREALRRLLLAHVAQDRGGATEEEAGSEAAGERDRGDAENQRYEAQGVLRSLSGRRLWLRY